MKKTVLIAVAAAVVLAACVTMEAEKAGTPRETTVTVNGNYIVVDQEPIIVRGQNVTIVWRIATSGYAFPSDGVVFRDPRGQFTCQPKGHIFLCQDRNTERGSFKYTIKVVSTGTAKTPYPLDPTVMND